MSDKKVLTKEIAEQFLEDEDSVDLSEFTAIEDDAAEVLAGCKSDLDLPSLAALTDTSARSLGDHKGYLNLGGIPCLSNTAISHLVKHNGDVSLEQLQELDVEGAKLISTALSQFVLDEEQFSDEVQVLLNVHPEFRLNESELEDWLLAELGFEHENEGDAWLSEETTEALETAADASFSWNDEDNCWFGTDIGMAPFDEGFSLVRSAWRRPINTVRLYDSQRTQLVFIGEVGEIKSNLQPILESIKSDSED